MVNEQVDRRTRYRRRGGGRRRSDTEVIAYLTTDVHLERDPIDGSTKAVARGYISLTADYNLYRILWLDEVVRPIHVVCPPYSAYPGEEPPFGEEPVRAAHRLMNAAVMEWLSNGPDVRVVAKAIPTGLHDFEWRGEWPRCIRCGYVRGSGDDDGACPEKREGGEGSTWSAEVPTPSESRLLEYAPCTGMPGTGLAERSE